MADEGTITGVEDLTDEELRTEVARRLAEEAGISAEWGSRFEVVAHRLARLLCKKQRGYGPKNVQILGETGVFDRIREKIERVLNLAEQSAPDVPGEIAKEVEDIAGLALILDMIGHDEWPGIEEGYRRLARKV